MKYWTGRSGLQVAGDFWGDRDTPPVLLLHGAGQTRHAWSVAGQRSAAVGYYAVALDSRGHGDSDRSEDDVYTQDAQVADLVSVLHEIGEPRPILVGASMGGVASLIAVGEGRVGVAELVLVDAAPHIETEGAMKIREFMDQSPEGSDSLEAVANAVDNYQPHRKRVGR
jgi:pimeloyl-ACP methyl ester carboxylesterase